MRRTAHSDRAGGRADKCTTATGLGPAWSRDLAGRRIGGSHLDLFLDTTLQAHGGLGCARTRDWRIDRARTYPRLRADRYTIWALESRADIAYVSAATQHLVPAVRGHVLSDGRVRCGGLCYEEVIETSSTLCVLPYWAGEEVTVRPWYAVPTHAYIYVEGERIAHVALDPRAAE